MASVDPTLTTIDAPGADLVAEPAWIALKAAATALQGLQIKNGSIPETTGDAGASKSATRTSAHAEAAAHGGGDMPGLAVTAAGAVVA